MLRSCYKTEIPRCEWYKGIVGPFAYCLAGQRKYIKAHDNLINKTRWKMINSNWVVRPVNIGWVGRMRKERFKSDCSRFEE